ncbi:ESPR-type extended signal peptide-containing protein [Veillonella atypica]
MNKIFKVVWSKTKECYVVVSEVAKNNSGKKKVLASVLAALAVVGAGTAQVDAAASFGAGGGTAAGDASISIGGGYPGPKTKANSDFAIAIGDNASATGKSSISMGYKAETNGQVSIAIGEESKVKKSEGTAVGPGAVVEERFGAAFGHEAKATKQYATAIGSGAQGEGEDSQAIGRQAQTTGYRAVAVGTLAKALNNSAVAIGEKSVADGTNSIAMGKMSKAHSFDAIAIGHNNNSRTYSAISIGTDNTSDVAYGLTDAQFDALPYDENNINDPNKTDPRRGVSSTIAIGRNNLAGNVEAIAIGTETKATKTDAIAIGARAEATGDYALAIGGAAGGYKVSAAEYGTAVGVRANAANRGAAFGAGSNAEAQKSVAIGYTAKASAQKATSNYEFSGSNGTLSPAGYNTETITINSKSAPTGGAVAGNYYDAGSAVAIGDGATVSDESDRAVVVGAGAKTNGNAHYSVVLGSGSHADASDGFVAGHGSSVASRESIAIGSGANVSGTENIRSQAIGFGATVSGTKAYDATAIGATAQVSGVQGGVALGSGSLLSRTTASNENIGWNSKYVDGTVVRNRAYKAKVNALDQWDAGAQIGAVSVGNDTQKRQIINVAAGNQDTDAVNVAQLKNVGVRVGADTNTATIGTNKVAADFLAYNGQLNIKGDNNRVTTVSENDANGKDANVNVKFDYDGLVKAKTGAAVTVDQKTDGNGKTYFEIDAAAASKTVVADGKNTTVTGAGTTASPYKVNVEGALTGISSITNNGGGKIEFTTGGTTISGGPVNVSNNKITGVAKGDVNATSTDAVNGSQLYAVKAAERHIAPTTTGHEYTVDSNGDVTMTYLDGNNDAVAGEQAVIKGIAKQNLSNITNDGKKVITGLSSKVEAGDNVRVDVATDPTTNQKTYTVNAITPAVYTDKAGNKLTKDKDGKFHKPDGTEVAPADVITSIQDAAGNVTGGNSIVNNVGSAIKNAGNAGDSFLTKLDAANTATPNAAVNVSDLKNTADGLTDKGLKFDANEGGVKTNKLGSKVTVQGTGSLTAGKAYADEYNTANIRTKIDQDSDGNTTINVGLAKALKDINSISNGNSSITLNSNPGGTGNTPAVSITGGNVDVGGNNITNLKSGGDTDSNAANIGDVKKIASDTDTHIKPGTYTVAADKTVTMTYVNGKGETVKANGQDVVAKIDLSGLSTGGTTASSWNVKSSANTTDGGAVADTHDANAQNIANGKSVEFQSGKNLVVKQTNDTTGGNATVEFSLSDKIGIGEKGQPGVPGKDGVDGKIGVNGKDGSSVVINGADGSIGMTGPKGQDGKDGINGRNGADISITSAKGEQVLINRDPAHNGDADKAERIVYVPKDASGNPIKGADNKNIVREVATMDDGLKFGGDMGTVGAVKLNKQVDVKGGITDTNKLATGNNIGVTSVPDATTGNTALNIQLAKDLTGLNSVELGGNTIKTDGDHITITTPDTTPGATPGATTTTKVANLSDEKHIKEGTYAVQNDGSVTLNYQDGNKKDLTETAKITGIAKQDLTNINDAGKNVITGLGTIVKAGDNVTVSEAADATTGQKTYTVNAVTPAIYTDKNGNKVVKRTDGTYTTNLDGSAGNDVAASDVIVSFKDAAGNTTGGNSIVNNIGSAINNHATPGVTSPTYLDKLDAAAGDTKTQNAAVNVTDLKNTADGLTDKGLNFTGNNESTVNKHKLGSLVKVQGEGTKEGTNAAGAKEIQTSDGTKFESAKDNIAVEADSIDKLTIKLNKNLKGINSISNGSTSITLNDAPNATTPAVTIKGGNLSMGDGTTNNKIVNLAPGTADTDAVNYGQIKGLRTEVKPGSNIVVNKTQDSTDGHDIYTISATATGGTASSWNIKSSADTANGGATATDHNANAVNISDQKTVEMVAGKNLTVKQGATTDGAKVEFALSDKIGIGEKGQPGVPGKDGVDGKIGVNGKDGSSVVINGADGSIGMTGPKGQDGKDGINGRNGADISITSAKGEQVLINRDPAHNGDADKAERIVYVPKDASGNPIKGADNKNIVREVATMDDGLKFGGDMGTVGAVKLNKQVDVKGGITDTNKLATGNNIGVTSVPDATTGNTALNIQLAKDLTGLNSVELGGNTIKTDGDHITITTPDTTPGATPGATTTTKVANLSDEKHIKEGTYAVQNDGSVTLNYQDGNKKDLTETAKITGIAKQDLTNINDAGKNVITGLGTIVKAGDNVTVSEAADATTGQKTYTVNAVTPAIYTDKNGNKVVKRTDGTYTTNLDGSAGNDVAATDVIVSFKEASGNTTGGNSIVNNVGSAINNHATPGVTSPTYLDKLDAAAGDTKTQNAAVNVTDLKNTADGLTDKGLNFTGNNESTVNKHKLGSLVKVQGEGTKEGTNATGTKEIQTSDGTKFESAKDNIAVEADSIDKLTIKLNKNLKGINSISNGSTSITLNDAPNTTTPAVTIKGGNLSMGDGTTNNKIVNLAPGTNDTDAVNYSQIKGLRTEVKQGANVTVSKTQGTDGHDIYTISAAATGGTASSWNIKSSADTANGGATATDHNANAVNISDQKTVEMVAGKNLTVKQGTTTDGAKVEFALSDKIGIGEKGQPGVAGKDGVDGKIGVNGKDGSSVVINGADGSIGMTGPQGKDGKDGINGRDGANISMTSAKGEQVLINRDPAHSLDTDKAERIVYVPKDASGNPIQDGNGKNIVREVATMDDGLKFGGDMGTVGAVKLNKQVDVKGGITDANKLATGNNIGVTSVPDATTGNTALNIQLAKDITGLNSVQIGGNTIKTDGDHITITTPSTTPGGNATVNKVANLGDELHITPGTYEVGAVDKDANAKNDEVTLTYTDGNSVEKANTFAKIKGVAKSDLSNINTDGKKVITGLSSVVKAGDNVTVSEKSDATTGQKTYTVNAVTPAVYTKADGTKVYKIVDPTTGAVTWNTSADGNGTPVNANEVIASFETPATGTTPGATTGGTMIVNNIGSAISGHEAKDTAGTVITSPTYLQRLETAAGDNLTKHAAVNVSDLNSAAKELKASELHIAPTEGGTDTDKGGGASGNTNAGAAAQAYKYNAATKQVELTFNNGNGKAVTGPKAVIDFSDLVIPAGGNNYGFNTNAGGNIKDNATTTATAVASGKTVTYAAGKNLTVEQKIGADGNQTYTYALNKDLTNLDKVVVNGKDGIDGKDGVSITGPKGESAPGAKDGQDGKVGIAGKDGKDAVSISGKDGVGHIGLTGPQGPAGTPGTPGTPGANIDISTDHGTQTLVKPEANNNDKSERIVYVPKDKDGNPLKDKDNNPIKREVATMDDGLRFTGNNTSKENKQEMNSLVKVQGEGVTENAAGKLEANGQEFKSAAGNIAVEADGGKTLTVKMNKDLNLTKDGSVTMGDTVVNNDGITIKAPTTPGTTTTDVKLTNQGLDNGGNTITNVAAGTANTDAVNVKQLKDKVTTVTSSDSSIKVVDKNIAGQPGYDAAKGHQYDITINNQGVVNNAQTPVVYTTEDGTKVYKQPDGTFTTNINGTGTVVPANQVIASMNSAGNSSTDPTKLQNVGSSIADKTGTTFLDKINTAAADPNAKYGAVNVTDLKSTSDALIDKGLVFDANNGDPKTNKLGSKVTIAGTGALGTTENFADKYNTDNIRTNIEQDGAGNTTVKIGLNKNLKGLESVSVPGKDGVDGQDGVSITGKDGANGVDGKVSIGKDGKDAVSISGKDGIGHIGLTGAAGKDGTNTKADITVKEGQPGLNGTDGITRIVYKDKDGNDHEVATHDDGVKYAGDDAQGTDKTKVISKKLNQTIDIVGGADKTKLTDNNIGVNNDGGKLKVQLANELAGINKISNGGSSITFNSNPGGATNTPAVQISGGDLNMGGNKITNVKNGTAPTDAATVGQLTKVEAGDNSVTVAHTTTADGQNVYTIKANPAGTVDLTNVNNRIDQLGEEVGRVGAQGAALSALKPIQYDPLEPTQIMAGYGNYRGNSAVALGVAHYKNESTLIHGGVSWAGGSSHMMANAGVTWKVGNRDSEAAVADRYRKGPISSTYAMQQEMAAMKAQNAGLKGEVSDLKAENEQMKAQIAAMMAKLGL